MMRRLAGMSYQIAEITRPFPSAQPFDPAGILACGLGFPFFGARE